MPNIYLSLIAAKLLEIKKEFQKYEPYCSGFHLDVMDNNFVPHLTFGADFINEMATIAQKPLFVHLMLQDPLDFIDRLHMRTDDIVSVQLASTNDPQTIINAIRDKKVHSSIAINPDIPLDDIYPYIKTLDQVVLMSVKAGFSGQEFIPSVKEKAKALVQYKKDNNLTFDICMDGGINESNIEELTQIGVNSFVIGTGVFDTPDPLSTLKRLQKL